MVKLSSRSLGNMAKLLASYCTINYYNDMTPHYNDQADKFQLEAGYMTLYKEIASADQFRGYKIASAHEHLKCAEPNSTRI